LLFATKPIVRLTSVTEVPDDTVPPLLTFGDLELLHHRLFVAGRTFDVRYVKYISSAYEGAVKARRRQAMLA